MIGPVQHHWATVSTDRVTFVLPAPIRARAPRRAVPPAGMFAITPARSLPSSRDLLPKLKPHPPAGFALKAASVAAPGRAALVGGEAKVRRRLSTPGLAARPRPSW